MRLAPSVGLLACMALACGPAESDIGPPELGVCDATFLQDWSEVETPQIVSGGAHLLALHGGDDWRLDWLDRTTGTTVQSADAASLSLQGLVVSEISAMENGVIYLAGSVAGTTESEVVRVDSLGATDWSRALPAPPARIFSQSNGVAVLDTTGLVIRFDGSGNTVVGASPPMGTVLDVEARNSGATKFLGTEFESGLGRPGTVQLVQLSGSYHFEGTYWHAFPASHTWQAGIVLDSFVAFAGSTDEEGFGPRTTLLQLGLAVDPRTWSADFPGFPLAIGGREGALHALLFERGVEGESYLRLAAFDDEFRITNWCRLDSDATREEPTAALVSASGDAFFLAPGETEGTNTKPRLFRVSLPESP